MALMTIIIIKLNKKNKKIFKINFNVINFEVNFF